MRSSDLGHRPYPFLGDVTFFFSNAHRQGGQEIRERRVTSEGHRSSQRLFVSRALGVRGIQGGAGSHFGCAGIEGTGPASLGPSAARARARPSHSGAWRNPTDSFERVERPRESHGRRHRVSGRASSVTRPGGVLEPDAPIVSSKPPGHVSSQSGLHRAGNSPGQPTPSRICHLPRVDGVGWGRPLTPG